MPLIPILIGVIVAGFAIGAALSVLGQRGTKEPVAIVTATPPTAGARPSPRMAATHTPKAGVRRTASPPKSPAPAKPSSSPTATPTPSRVVTLATARATSAPTPAPTVALTAAPTPLPTLPPPRVRVTAAPVAVVATPIPQPVDEADSDFARLAAGVVRSYLAALARGDDVTASAAIGAPAGSRAARLTEKEFADRSLRIVKLDAHGTSDSANVNVDLSTSKGAYFAQFSLRRSSSGAALIVEHTFIKP